MKLQSKKTDLSGNKLTVVHLNRVKGGGGPVVTETAGFATTVVVTETAGFATAVKFDRKLTNLLDVKILEESEIKTEEDRIA